MEIICLPIVLCIINLDVLNFEYLFWFFPLHLPVENKNKYLIFKIWHIQSDELSRTLVHFLFEFGQIENTFWNFPIIKGTGYVGIGWRPKSATKQCQAYPKLYDKETAAKSLWLDNEKKQGKSAEPEAGEFNKSQRNKICI